MKFKKYDTHRDMLIIGHRGAGGYEVENSLASFQRALDLGVAMVELDTYACATGELVVIHDEDVSITTNGHGDITQMSFHDLRKLKIKGDGQIPTLQEVIELINQRAVMNIELKQPNTAQALADIIKKYLQKGWLPENFVISSFNLKEVGNFKKIFPNIKAGILFELEDMPSNMVKIAKQYHADAVGLNFKVITKKLIEKLHDAGILVFAWTVNDKKTADKMRECKVDGVVSDYPDKI